MATTVSPVATETIRIAIGRPGASTASGSLPSRRRRNKAAASAARTASHTTTDTAVKIQMRAAIRSAPSPPLLSADCSAEQLDSNAAAAEAIQQPVRHLVIAAWIRSGATRTMAGSLAVHELMDGGSVPRPLSLRRSLAALRRWQAGAVLDRRLRLVAACARGKLGVAVLRPTVVGQERPDHDDHKQGGRR